MTGEPKAEIRPASTPITKSVDAWLDRVEKYVVRDRQTQRILGSLEDSNESEPRALCAVEAAKLLCQAAAFADGSSPAGRAFWRLWAREVMADAGVSSIEGEDFCASLSGLSVVITVRPPAIVPPQEFQRSAVLRGLAAKLAAYGDQKYPHPNSAEHFAFLLEALCMTLDAARAEGSKDEARLSAQAAMIITKLLSEAHAQRLLPYAEAGRDHRVGSSRGGRRSAEVRFAESCKILQRVEALKSERLGRTKGKAVELYLQETGSPAGPKEVESLSRRLRSTAKKLTGR